ncbi:WxL domain-containing protein [Enterococcus faecalis]|uniref:WxL domain-containing protein n=1 Tax=Enterococcus faecalis TaxID=1351 RepID=UPI002455DB2C|nr:WxL domain-containing protein [Enterococcus faecalis]MDH5040276.1 WxL domain-containing protein [Enterococcus faecalis]MDV2932148.1 WxL domain-containing protein [Enterococcus faecalis]
MKKSILSTIAVLGLTFGGGAINSYAAEANPTAELTSEASLTIQPGILSLDAVSNFNFGELTIQDVAESDQTLTGTPEITKVSDYRGPNESGWMLSLKLSDIKNENNVKLQSAKLNLATTRAKGDATVTATTTIDAGTTEPTLVASASGTTGLAANEFDLSNTTLTFPKQNINSGRYRGTVTWVLTNAYTPE